MIKNLFIAIILSLMLIFAFFTYIFENKITYASVGVGQCREPICGNQPSEMPRSCPQGQMTWPKTGACVLSDCEKQGFTLSRDAFGNCVPKGGPCEETGYIRDSKGNCIPNVETQSDNKNTNSKENNRDPLSKFFDNINFAKEIWDSYYPGKGYGPTSVTFSPDGTVTECVNKYGNTECGTYQGSYYGLPSPSKTTTCNYNEGAKRWDCK